MRRRGFFGTLAALALAPLAGLLPDDLVTNPDSFTIRETGRMSPAGIYPDGPGASRYISAALKQGPDGRILMVWPGGSTSMDIKVRTADGRLVAEREVPEATDRLEIDVSHVSADTLLQVEAIQNTYPPPVTYGRA